MAIYAGLAGGIGLLLYGIFLIARATGGTGLPLWAGAMIVFGMLAGVAATVMVGLLARYSFDPQAHPLRRVSPTHLAFGVVGAGMLAVVTGFSNPNLLILVGPGVVPAIAVLFLVVRPRFRAIATARGRPAPLSFQEKREKELAEARRQRAAQTQARERYEKLKKQRLGASTSDRRSGKKTAGR